MSSCNAWAKNDPLMLDYHDTRWCKPCYDDQEIFAMLCLEGQQAGLSWSTVIHKEAAIRQAFDNFEIDIVANYDDKKIAALMQNPAIIRSRLKLKAAVRNARAVQKIISDGEFSSFSDYVWHFTDGRRIINQFEDISQTPVQSELSIDMSKDMKKRGFSFVGPVICYSFLQAIGIIDDHLPGCPFKSVTEQGSF